MCNSGLNVLGDSLDPCLNQGSLCAQAATDAICKFLGEVALSLTAATVLQQQQPLTPSRGRNSKQQQQGRASSHGLCGFRALCGSMGGQRAASLVEIFLPLVGPARQRIYRPGELRNLGKINTRRRVLRSVACLPSLGCSWLAWCGQVSVLYCTRRVLQTEMVPCDICWCSWTYTRYSKRCSSCGGSWGSTQASGPAAHRLPPCLPARQGPRQLP